jgi:hypothetical protein
MEASQRTAGIAFLSIGGVLGAVALALAATQQATRPVFFAAFAGAVATLCITLAYWRVALERSGFYGASRKSAAYRTKPNSRPGRLVGAGAVIGAVLGPTALVIAGSVLGLTSIAILACIASFFGAMSLAAGALHFGLLAAAGAKWRLRGGA